MNKFLICFLLIAGCSQPDRVQTKKYIVVSMFNEVLLETDEKAEAYERAYNLTSFGRVFASKPFYFVVEK